MHTLKQTLSGKWEVYSGPHLLCTVLKMFTAIELVSWLNGGAPITEIEPDEWARIVGTGK